MGDIQTIPSTYGPNTTGEQFSGEIHNFDSAKRSIKCPHCVLWRTFFEYSARLPDKVLALGIFRNFRKWPLCPYRSIDRASPRLLDVINTDDREYVPARMALPTLMGLDTRCVFLLDVRMRSKRMGFH